MGLIGWESWWKIVYEEWYELCDEIDCKKCPAKLAQWNLTMKGHAEPATTVAEPAPSAPSHTAPAAPSPPVITPSAPSAEIPDTDDLEKRLKAALDDWIKRKGIKR